MESKNCKICGKKFIKKVNQSRAYWEKREGCSYKCSFKIRSNKYKPYERTKEHRILMSESHKRNERIVEYGRERFIKINKAKKGKKIEEIYGGKRAFEIRLRLKKYGVDNNNWKGGRSFSPYTHEFNKKLRESIKTRDGFICKNCGIDEASYKRYESLGRGLTIHHVDYNKNNCLEKNLITLCKTCNSKANSNRDIWMKKYQKLLGQ